MGGRVEVPVQAAPGCSWTAATNAPWLTIAGSPSGTGSGAVALQVAAGPGPTRMGTVTVAGIVVTIVQGSGCTFATGVSTLNVTAAGGRAEVPVLAPPDCAWAAAVDVPWIALAAGQTGTGGGTIVLEIGASAGASRTGTVAVGGVTVTIVQGSNCTYAPGVPSISATAAGGVFDVPLTAPAGCAWTAVSQASWIDVTSGGSGSGTGVVRLSVRSSDGPARSGSVTVAGTNLPVTQASGCRFDVSPLTYDALAGGSTSSTSVQAGAGCAWTAASGVPWINLSLTSGSGAAPVGFSIAANDGPQRSGTFTVAGQTISVRQPSRCTWTLAPPAVDYDGNGGRASVLVIVVGGCTWTTESTVSWITLETGAAGTGDGLVQFIVDPNPGGSRSGVVRIAGIDLVVRQTPR
jgi:hypothetical protein